MTFNAWWKNYIKTDLLRNWWFQDRAAKAAWDASRKTTRQAILEYMNFVEEEWPENERWEILKNFVEVKNGDV